MYEPIDVENIFRITKIYTLFECRYHEGYEYKGEIHNFWEFIVVLDGTIGVMAGNEVLVLKKGQAILHKPMEFHRLWSEENTCPKLIIFSFEAENMPTFSSKIFEVEDLSGFKSAKRILGHYYGDGDQKEERRDRKSYQLAIKELEMFLIQTVSKNQVEKVTVNSRAAENYAAIVNTIENNLDQCLTVYELSRLCRMSEVNLKKTFARFSGRGVINYYNERKMTLAVSMLEKGMSVGEVAASLGFSNQNYFSAAFKRITGRSPSFYKKMVSAVEK